MNNFNNADGLRDPMIFSRVHRNISVLLRNDLSPAKGDGNNSPLEHFDRFSNITIIVISEGKRLEFKMPPEKWFFFREEYSVDREIDAQTAEKEKKSGIDARAYEPLKFSKCRGKSIVEVVNEGPQMVQLLGQELQAGAGKYKRNGEFLAILNQAVRMKQAGISLEQGKKTSQLYPDVGPAVSPRPNLYKRFPDGSCPGSECSIVWQHGDGAYPIQISVRKCRYKANKLQDGRLQTTARQVEEAVNVSITRAEWIKLVNDACFQIECFKQMMQAQYFAKMKDVERANKQRYLSQNQNR